MLSPSVHFYTPYFITATIRTFPRFDNMMGHDYIWLSGPCFDSRDELWLRYGDAENPIAITNCSQQGDFVAWCTIPTFYQIGRLPIALSRDDGDTYSNEGTFDIGKWIQTWSLGFS